MKKSGRMRVHSHSRSHKRYTRTRRHMRGGWPGEEEKCIKDNQSLIMLKKYIADNWPKVTYDRGKRYFNDFDDADAEKLRKKFAQVYEKWFEENKDVMAYNPRTKSYPTPDSLVKFDNVYETLIQGLISIKRKNDCNGGVALYYLTIVKFFKKYFLFKGMEPPPPPSRREYYAPSSHELFMSRALARELEATPEDPKAAALHQQRKEAAALRQQQEEAALHQQQKEAAAEEKIIKELKDAGFTDSELKAAGFTAYELKDAGFKASELKAAGFTAYELESTAGFTAYELKDAGFTAYELKDAGFKASVLKEAGFTESVLKEAGFTESDRE